MKTEIAGILEPRPKFYSPTNMPGRLLRTLGWLVGVWLLVHPAVTKAQTTLLFEGFEGTFPGVIWTVGNAGSGPTWDDVNSTFGGEGTHGGSWKGYCAGTAYPFNSNEPNPVYTNNMAAYMQTAVSLRSCENLVLLRFWYKLPSIESCCDSARVFIDQTQIWSNSTPQTSWTEVVLDLSPFAGDLHTLRFEFDSDVSITGEGWYLDDIAVLAYDTAPPTVTCSSNIVVNADPGQCSKSNVTFTATATDNCSIGTLLCSPPSGSTFPVGVNTVICKAIDAAGNTNECSFTVTVRDAPVIVCPSNVVALTCSNSTSVIFKVAASNQCSYGTSCLVPDNGSGTANLPPVGCQYTSAYDNMRIVDGLQQGATIEIRPVLKDFVCSTGGVSVCSFTTKPDACSQSGGTLGGEQECSAATLAVLLTGTGPLTGYTRPLNIPVSFETHAAPRTPGSPMQSFDTDMFRFFGQLPPGDPDFDLLRITAGTDFGMPSPGHTTLSQSGGNWAVDSFFDITYRIDFVGAPGGPFAGHSGSTTATVRIWTGSEVPPLVTCTPPSGSLFPLGTNLVTCVASNVWGRTNSCEFLVIVLPDTRPPMLTCPSNMVVQTCSSNAQVTFFVVASNYCGYAPNCALPDNGSGTANLPPAGCEYVAPFDSMWIIDGLPPTGAIQMRPILGNMACTGGVSVCSFATSPGSCAQSGGSLGGEKSCSDATLALSLMGTGSLAGFNRSINLPVGFEIHTAPRSNGAPVQTFAADLFRLFGQITGDPDFDLLRIVAGTDFGMPSPGQTTLTRQLDGTWAVDSFFDVTYRVDFVGKAGGPLSGLSGSTTASVRLRTGAGLYPKVISTPASGSLFQVGVTPVMCVVTNEWGTNSCEFNVTVSSVAPPVLGVVRQGTNIVLHWPELCTAYKLQSAPTFVPPANWDDVTNVPMHAGGVWQVSVVPASSRQFYRLAPLP